MSYQPHIAVLTRVTDRDGRTLYFATPSRTRSRPVLNFIDKERVPDFERSRGYVRNR